MIKHGMSTTPIYNSWENMKQRCNNKKNPHYKNYGGRGISYDPKWENFLSFFEDVGPRPKDKTLGRIDNNSGYSKENCRWETWKEQHRNTRKSQLIFYKGEERSFAEISRLTGLSQNLLSKRRKRGWPDAMIVSVKPQINGKGGKSYPERNFRPSQKEGGFCLETE